ncbi:TetR/AcrR family transcriptional regulator [Streptomyces tubercidicus]|uniref:TetR family transcriptional regulator n=1 Tax=Streptomyces tubercidicus TaxID=47759 RepID=A0A640UZK4_9ACTN|nr:TetR/AcrR family transcriptional regulator [Streptomyces tubercidicus]WAU14867.1 TetR/AcrR family transcriptional regulator [Streptomyces tubercidicus]GFE40660.1 TetR family transcriptional regulator [Streptomyces tubercidicus]
MSRLIEHDSAKAARILDSARDLVVEHGVRKVTIAEIAAAAGVGKGTVYLYWETKEDLFVGLAAREVLGWIDTVTTRIGQDPHTVLPRHLAPLLIRTTHGNPWLRWLRSDDSALRQLLHRPADQERFADASPSAMGNAVITILRDHGIVRDDLPLARQMYALHAVLVGFGNVMAHPAGAGPLNVDDPETALADTVHLLLEKPRDPAARVVAQAAEAVRARFTEIHDSLLELVAAGAAGTR